MADYHEPPEELGAETRDISRAIKSLREELEAIDWYHQRVMVTGNDSLKKIMAHNRDEEIEHACMAIEWLRRNMPGWDEELRDNLFKEGPIHEHGHGEDDEEESERKPGNVDLNIGKLS
jgi:uncharacterized protein